MIYAYSLLVTPAKQMPRREHAAIPVNAPSFHRAQPQCKETRRIDLLREVTIIIGCVCAIQDPLDLALGKEGTKGLKGRKDSA
jgi:hypothetical protein